MLTQQKEIPETVGIICVDLYMQWYYATPKPSPLQSGFTAELSSLSFPCPRRLSLKNKAYLQTLLNSVHLVLCLI